MNVIVVDIGKPGANFGWAMVGDTTGEGTGIDVCVQPLAAALRNGPPALGFEAPMFVPIRTDPKRLTAVCKGDSGKGEAQQAVLRKRRCNRTRDWAGGRVLILGTLRPLVSEATVTLGWRSLLVGPGRRMRFEAFVTDQRKTPDTRHVKDAHLAIATFQRGMRDLATFQSSVEEPIRLSLLGAMISSHLLAGHPQIHGGDPSSTLDDLVSEADLAVEFEGSRLHGERTRGRPRLRCLIDNPHALAESRKPQANTKPVGPAPTIRTSVTGIDDSCIVSDHRHLVFCRLNNYTLESCGFL